MSNATDNRIYREPAIEVDHGGPAFPADPVYLEPKTVAEGMRMAHGMSLRDYFAAQAMAGICAHPDTWGLDAEEIAKYAYISADAMLRARGAV